MYKNFELLPLTSDFVFKRVFTKDGHEYLLKSLLSSILDIEIEEIEIKNPELTKESKEAKLEILDIRAKINNNTMIDIEMQVRDYKNMDKRAISYLTKLHYEQLEVGTKYEDTHKTICINILNFNFVERNTYHSISRMKYEEIENQKYVDMGYLKDAEYATTDIEMHFIELPKFIKKNPGVKRKLEQWLWFISGEGEKIEMAKKENENIKKASEVLEAISQSPEERLLFEARQRRWRDEMSLRDYAKKEGIKEGLQQGIEKGKREGILQGLEKGKHEEKLKTAKKMLDEGLSVELIIKITGLTNNDITILLNE